ncbi:MAG: aspartate aminotransferase family protein [Candidatus Kerfeldbacteria bacterium]|nr:aspartate aminotransferase family protein [Candidatus Kerfeldbacteria bacterium]
MPALADHFSRDIAIVDGDGCYVTDRDGRRYIDFVAGWCVGTVGWKHHAVVTALKRQAEHGLFVPALFRYPAWEQFAKQLVDLAPGSRLQRAWRCTSGSEAIEFAIKCARAATGKKTIVSIDGVYHGHTYGAASVGDAMTPDMAPGVPGFMKLPLPNQYHGVDTGDVISRFEHLLRASHDVAAFLSEPVFTNAGVILPPSDFYPEIQRLCRQHGVLVMMDEVATGFGRCGALFASSLWGLEPDVLCLGKGMTGGYGTMGATLVSEEIFQRSKHIPQLSTFGWAAQDMAAAQAVIDVILRERLWENAHGLGMYLIDQLRALESRPYVGQVRNAGLLLGMEIVKDKSSKKPDPERAEKLAEDCARSGLLIETAGNVLFMSPPIHDVA